MPNESQNGIPDPSNLEANIEAARRNGTIHFEAAVLMALDEIIARLEQLEKDLESE